MKNQFSIFILFFTALVLSSCRSNPHKAERVETEIKNQGAVSGDTTVGIKNGEMVVQRKVQMNEELRRLQVEVYELEDRVNGNRKYGSFGLYGSLRECRMQVSDPKNGGDGKLKWTEPLDRVTDKEEDFKIGLDEKDKLVGVSEEYLKDRIERFKGYKATLIKRQDDYEDKLQICKAELKAQMAAKANNFKE